MKETPYVRPGKVTSPEPAQRVVAVFRNAAQGNLVIQQMQVLGIPSDRLGVTPPDRMPEGQGMILSIPCPTDAVGMEVEKLCRQQGASIHHQRA